MTDTTWIKIYRKIMDNGMFQDSKTLHVFLFLLLKANVKQSEWCGRTIKRGQLVTSYGSISENTGMSISSARRAMKSLMASGEIITEPTNRYNLVTIVKYNDYQDKYADCEQPDEQSGEQSAEHRIKNTKNVKNKKSKSTSRSVKQPTSESGNKPGRYVKKIWERTRNIPKQYLGRFDTEDAWDLYVEQHREEVEKAYGL